jgi:hypothetical protein
MLQGGFTSVLQVKNRDELLAEVVASLGGWGLRRCCMAPSMITSGETEFISIDNTPRRISSRFENLDNGRAIP